MSCTPVDKAGADGKEATTENQSLTANSESFQSETRKSTFCDRNHPPAITPADGRGHLWHKRTSPEKPAGEPPSRSHDRPGVAGIGQSRYRSRCPETDSRGRRSTGTGTGVGATRPRLGKTSNKLDTGPFRQINWTHDQHREDRSNGQPDLLDGEARRRGQGHS